MVSMVFLGCLEIQVFISRPFSLNLGDSKDSWSCLADRTAWKLQYWTCKSCRLFILVCYYIWGAVM